MASLPSSFSGISQNRLSPREFVPGQCNTSTKEHRKELPREVISLFSPSKSSGQPVGAKLVELADKDSSTRDQSLKSSSSNPPPTQIISSLGISTSDLRYKGPAPDLLPTPAIPTTPSGSASSPTAVHSPSTDNSSDDNNVPDTETVSSQNLLSTMFSSLLQGPPNGVRFLSPRLQSYNSFNKSISHPGHQSCAEHSQPLLRVKCHSGSS